MVQVPLLMLRKQNDLKWKYYMRHVHTTNVTTNRVAENKVGVVEGYTNLHVHAKGGLCSSPSFCGICKIQ